MSSEGRGRDEVATEADVARASSPGSARRIYLLVREGPSTRVLELGEGAEIVVGRADNADVVVEDTRASRRHARFMLRGEELSVEDLGSRNGTRVRGEKVIGGTRSVEGGDVVEVGHCEIVVATAARRTEPQGATAGGDGIEIGDDIIVADAATAKVFALAKRVAAAPTTVLVLGETGVGKDVVARQIHAWSPRSAAPFVRVNCAALPESLVESELFGHEKGAFTGAERRKPGWFEAAEGGTLLLDEIGELPLGAQAKLLHALENRVIVRVGGTKEMPVDVRAVCATHRDLPAAVAAGRFREDLFYRISAFTLRMPPLRERPSEVALLAELFARRFAERLDRPAPTLSPEARDLLLARRWPGNIRELRNAIEHAIVLVEGAVLLPEHLPEAPPASPVPSAGADRVAGRAGARALPSDGMRGELEEIERQRIVEALTAEGGNQTRAAQRLGISRRTLVYRLSKYGIGR